MLAIENIIQQIECRLETLGQCSVFNILQERRHLQLDAKQRSFLEKLKIQQNQSETFLIQVAMLIHLIEIGKIDLLEFQDIDEPTVARVLARANIQGNSKSELNDLLTVLITEGRITVDEALAFKRLPELEKQYIQAILEELNKNIAQFGDENSPNLQRSLINHKNQVVSSLVKSSVDYSADVTVSEMTTSRPCQALKDFTEFTEGGPVKMTREKVNKFKNQLVETDSWWKTGLAVVATVGLVALAVATGIGIIGLAALDGSSAHHQPLPIPTPGSLDAFLFFDDAGRGSSGKSEIDLSREEAISAVECEVF
ncbi:hypothetical protein [Piscirickettsia litoralis]|uniref:Uncharacterized protein n=1 Tax=Piscirickettsia litoralis TaxID=1891921 RepID=A0ABX3A2D7_9GAMM|nr:hypothetical protein [Piscirickettsia litoralis]ODN41798.1 hypothetical protein BGC07_00885 [Piscirickettsia litoralis]